MPKNERKNLPGVLMIAIKNDPVSEHYVSISKPSWERRGYNVTLVDAVTPDTIESYTKECGRYSINFGIKKTGRGAPREFTPTEKAIWCSHHQCWRITERKKNPAIIVEHDGILLSDVIMSQTVPVVKDHWGPDVLIGIGHCGALSKSPEKGKRISAGVAYVLGNNAAQTLKKYVPRPVMTNSDAYLHQAIEKRGLWLQHCVTQYYDPNIGTTIDHGA